MNARLLLILFLINEKANIDVISTADDQLAGSDRTPGWFVLLKTGLNVKGRKHRPGHLYGLPKSCTPVMPTVFAMTPPAADGQRAKWFYVELANGETDREHRAQSVDGANQSPSYIPQCQ